jgi:hypothetical protein
MRLHLSRVPASAFVFLAACTLTAPALADDRAAAQRLFEQGQALFKEGKTAEACAKFDGAAALVSSPGVRLNLARCWEKIGRTASAWTRYDEALVAAERVGDAAAAAAARQGRDALAPRLTKLVITLADASAASKIQITRDGEALPPSVVGSDLPVDPGAHQIAARAPGFKEWSTRVDAAGEGATVRVSIPALEREPVAQTAVAVGATATVTPNAEPPHARSSSPLRTVGIVTGAVGVVGLGLGTYFGLTASSKWKGANRSGNTCLDASCPSATQEASNDATLSTVFFIAGGVLAATGVTLWLVAPRGGGTEGTALRPAVGPGIAGLELAGSFR